MYFQEKCNQQYIRNYKINLYNGYILYLIKNTRPEGMNFLDDSYRTYITMVRAKEIASNNISKSGVINNDNSSNNVYNDYINVCKDCENSSDHI